ncbi:hypothetical protein FPQ18DRAFT_47849 [Pyronema domesticum]|nr:hypothetical protein FPQ18DRAFT_47849 [Pyronema domesticum]
MAPKKKVTMGLGEFLADETYGTAAGGSWADEMEDFPPMSSGAGTSSGYGARRNDYGSASNNTSSAPSGGNDRLQGYSRVDDGERFARTTLPIPDKPPYTTHIGNLDFSVSEEEIKGFFANCDVLNVRLVRDREQDRPKGFGYVEFNSREGLVAALDLTGQNLAGRPVRISVAEPPKERVESRSFGPWRSGGPPPTLKEEHTRTVKQEEHTRIHDGPWQRNGRLPAPAPSADGGNRPERRIPNVGDGRTSWRSERAAVPAAPTSPTPTGPPKLALAPRTLPVNAEAATTSSSSVFGSATPVNTADYAEEVMRKRREQKKAEAEKAEAERKKREEEAAAAQAAAAEKAKNEPLKVEPKVGGRNPQRREFASPKGSDAPQTKYSKEWRRGPDEPEKTELKQAESEKTELKQAEPEKGTDSWSTVTNNKGRQRRQNKTVAA